MPDNDGPSYGASHSALRDENQTAGRGDPTDAPIESRNLPVPVPRPSEIARENGEGWIERLLRSLFGWKTGTIRADLAVVLEAGHPGDTGFSPEESTMLKNILGLREGSTGDLMA